jgi:hypothetical protein
MSKDDDIVWQAQCCLCGWKSSMGTFSQCKEDRDIHVLQEHPFDFKIQAWMKDQGHDEPERDIITS